MQRCLILAAILGLSLAVPAVNELSKASKVPQNFKYTVAQLQAMHQLPKNFDFEEAKCTLCSSVVNSIELALISEYKEIEAYANHLCDVITEANAFFDPICKWMANEAIEFIVDWIKKHEKPEYVCQQLSLCPV